MDDAVINCQCGTKLRLPANRDLRGVRCPKCKAVIGKDEFKSEIAVHAVNGSGNGLLCPICQSAIGLEDTSHTCSECAQVHHEECWSEIGGCSAYGCSQAPAMVKELVSDQPLTAWGDDKTCPICGEKIKSIALKCRYCGTTFDTVDPLSMRDLHRKDRKATEQNKLCNTVIVLFAISLLLGCAAPLMAIINPIYILPRRKELAVAGPFYLILGYSAIALTILYSVLILLFVLIGGID